MVKNIASFNLNENLLGTLETLSKSKGLSKSVLVERLVTVGLKSEVELTAEQRYHFSRCVIQNKCADILRLSGILMFEGGVSDQISVLMALQLKLQNQKNRENRYGIMKMSIFEVLEDVKAFDKNVFDKIIHENFRYKKLLDEYFYLYKK